jgi:DnaJ-domain-containing protein 1
MPGRPATAAAPPGYPTARPVSSPSGFIAVPPAAPAAARPASGPSAVIAPPVARPAGSPSGVLAPPVAPGAKPVGGPPAPARQGPLPETGAIETITPQQAAALRKLAASLDTLDYYQALGVTHQASPGDIKKAFYRESRTYHPDRFFHLPDSEVKVDLGAIYRRLTEAYFVLRDDAKRKKYLADVTGPDRANKLRYTEATEAELKAEARKAAEEEYGNHPKARPLFKAALADIANQNWAQAERNLKSGLMYDPGNARFKEQLAEVQKKVEEQRKASSSGYMIK